MDNLTTILKGIAAEYLDADLLSSKVAQVDNSGTRPRVVLEYPYPAISIAARAKQDILRQVHAAGGDVDIKVRFVIKPRIAQGGAQSVPGVANIIAVASTKGGVGKSMVATNLALALHAEGARAGLLDADIYGPSLPQMLGGGKPQVNDKEQLVPHQLQGIQALSIGHLVEADQAVIWRGPMVVRGLQQLLRGAAWNQLDFLVIDMPPGTGDIQLSIAQTVPVNGALIVTTPQELALADAMRGLQMFERVSIPVLGYVVNMAAYICPDCGAEHAIFGDGAEARLTKRLGVPEFSRLPLDPALGAACAAGTPVVAAEPDGALATIFRTLASRTGAALTAKNVDRSGVFPKIVVSND